jgi:hypothetical protein
VETPSIENWRLYCAVCTMYALPGRDRCDYCSGPLTARKRRAAPALDDLNVSRMPGQASTLRSDASVETADALAVEGTAYSAQE